MPASSNGPYKSRLFNFFNRQAIRFNDQLGTSIRHLKIAAEMGVQLLLYPVYLMVQSGRSLRRQLEQRVKPSLYLPVNSESESKSQLQLPLINKSIEEVLTKVESWLTNKDNDTQIQKDKSSFLSTLTVEAREDNYFLTPENSSIISSELTSIESVSQPIDRLASSQASMTIRGIATQLNSGNLVLVTKNNQIVDIFNSKQQELLQQYFRQKQETDLGRNNFLTTATKKFLASLPQIPKDKSKSLPPVRFLWQVVDWIQTSPVAIAANLFGESQQISSVRALPSKPIPSDSVDLPEFLVLIDNTLANLETKPLNTASIIVHQWSDNLKNLSQQLSKIVQVNSSLSKTTSNNPLSKNQRYTSQPISPTDAFQIQSLIRAAIDYFLAKREAKSLTTRDSLPPSADEYFLNSLGKSDFVAEVDKQEPWLSWEDIFSSISSPKLDSQESKEIAIIENETSQKSLPVAFVEENKLKQSIITKIKSRFQKRKSRSRSIIPTKSTQLAKTQPKNSSISYREDATTSESSESLSFPAKGAEDWVETQATPVGYVEHPVEKVLGLLDKIMLLLEELALQIWEKIKQINPKN
jgi:hypothetical protein